MLNGEKLNISPLGFQQGKCMYFHSYNQHYTQSPKQCNKVRKRTKCPINWKWRNKTVIIHRHYDCLKNLELSAKEVLELISEFSKVGGHKFN